MTSADTTAPRPTVGMVGLGNLGLPIAANLIADGHRVVGYRRTAMDDFVAAGGEPAGSPREVAEQSDLVLVCLPTAEALRDVVSGPDGLCAGLRPGSVVVELGTFPIGDKLHARDALQDVGATLLDAPVSGTPPMVGARQAVVMVSGDDAAIEAARPGLEAIGIVRPVGAFGNGSKLKYVANSLVAIHTAAAAEVVALAETLDLDVGLTIDTISAGPATSRMFDIRAPWMASRDVLPAKGSVSILRKDLAVISEVAGQAGARMPMLAAASSLYDEASEAGRGEHDIATLVTVLAGEELSPTS